MSILSPALYNIRTTRELADTLNVPVPALRLVLLAPLSCIRSKCSLSAALNNRGYCILCSQRWFPLEFDPQGRPALNHPNTLCKSIGYIHHGMFCFPKDPEHAAEAACVLGMPPHNA